MRGMAADLERIDIKLCDCNIFGRLSKEKREELVDAIYMSALRSNLPIADAIRIIRTSEVLNKRFFSSTSGNIFNFIDKDFRAFAKRIFLKKAGGGTPNAAMGKAELLLLLFSDKTNKPAKGDIYYDGRQIEIKTNGGKIGLGQGQVINKEVVDYCKRNKINLPIASRGKAANGKRQFNPANPADRKFVGRALSKVLAAWWKAVSGESIQRPSWSKVRKEFLKRVARQELPSRNMELLVFDNSGNFRFFKRPSDIVRYYDNNNVRFECRGYQKNPIAIYLDIFSG